jgi:SNF2 family DNA or RNA helicase
LLCGGTVEEKVAALQESKRNLAESIISTSESLIRDLDRQTLEMLLS